MLDNGSDKKEDARGDGDYDEHDSGELHRISNGTDHFEPRIVVLFVVPPIADEVGGIVRDFRMLLEECGQHRVIRHVIRAVHQRGIDL